MRSCTEPRRDRDSSAQPACRRSGGGEARNTDASRAIETDRVETDDPESAGLCPNLGNHSPIRFLRLIQTIFPPARFIYSAIC